MEEENGIDMTRVVATNITSPLGFTTEDNYQAIKSGSSLLKRHDSWHGIPTAFTASLFTDEQMEAISIDGFTRFESIAIHSIKEALGHATIDLASQRTILLLSTTKANVGELAETPEKDNDYLSPGATAKKISKYFGIATDPIVICNACISGVTAQLLADRLISDGFYDTVIVCGADCQSAFVVSGFMSFKSLSPDECRPFDIERLGLNLGEAASTIIYKKSIVDDNKTWNLISGCLTNDAYHVSAPSPLGDGSYAAISHTIKDYKIDDIALINVHGTATMFNDQMESKAIERASLSSIPIQALKGYYGHTLGASGVLESVITMRALDEGVILPTRGFSEVGVSGKITISNLEQTTDKRTFLKIISGFGGCNGALLFAKNQATEKTTSVKSIDLKEVHNVFLTSDSLNIDGQKVSTSAHGKELLTEIYKNHIGDYPKFYKMDIFSRLVFVVSELLVQLEEKENHSKEHAVILFNRSSSIVADRNHLSTINDADNFFPSPSVFLYTLPNIVTGEIAIKNSFKGETSLYILNDKNEELINQVIKASVSSNTHSIITGWVDCSDENTFEADIKILTINE